MRSGTDNVPGIAGLAKSAEIVYRHFDEQTAQMRACKHRLIEGLRELDDVVIHACRKKRVRRRLSMHHS